MIDQILEFPLFGSFARLESWSFNLDWHIHSYCGEK